MANELSMLELEAELAIELPERPMMRHHTCKKHHHHHHHHHNNDFGGDFGDDFGGNNVRQQMNNIAFANAVGFGAHAAAANFSIGNTQNFQSFDF